ncbi:MAG: hypothetical protein ACOC44_16320 [Promethearchaeia archaeon]
MNDLYYQCKGIESWEKCKVKLQKKIKGNDFVKNTRQKLEKERFKKKFRN